MLCLKPRRWRVLKLGLNWMCRLSLESLPIFLRSFWQKHQPIFRNFSRNAGPFFTTLLSNKNVPIFDKGYFIENGIHVLGFLVKNQPISSTSQYTLSCFQTGSTYILKYVSISHLKAQGHVMFVYLSASVSSWNANLQHVSIKVHH